MALELWADNELAAKINEGDAVMTQQFVNKGLGCAHKRSLAEGATECFT